MGAEWFSRSDSPNLGYRYPVDLLPALKREVLRLFIPIKYDLNRMVYPKEGDVRSFGESRHRGHSSGGASVRSTTG